MSLRVREETTPTEAGGKVPISSRERLARLKQWLRSKDAAQRRLAKPRPPDAPQAEDYFLKWTKAVEEAKAAEEAARKKQLERERQEAEAEQAARVQLMHIDRFIESGTRMKPRYDALTAMKQADLQADQPTMNIRTVVTHLTAMLEFVGMMGNEEEHRKMSAFLELWAEIADEWATMTEFDADARTIMSEFSDYVVEHGRKPVSAEDLIESQNVWCKPLGGSESKGDLTRADVLLDEGNVWNWEEGDLEDGSFETAGASSSATLSVGVASLHVDGSSVRDLRSDETSANALGQKVLENLTKYMMNQLKEQGYDPNGDAERIVRNLASIVPIESVITAVSMAFPPAYRGTIKDVLLFAARIAMRYALQPRGRSAGAKLKHALYREFKEGWYVYLIKIFKGLFIMYVTLYATPLAMTKTAIDAAMTDRTGSNLWVQGPQGNVLQLDGGFPRLPRSGSQIRDFFSGGTERLWTTVNGTWTYFKKRDKAFRADVDIEAQQWLEFHPGAYQVLDQIKKVRPLGSLSRGDVSVEDFAATQLYKAAYETATATDVSAAIKGNLVQQAEAVAKSRFSLLSDVYNTVMIKYEPGFQEMRKWVKVVNNNAEIYEDHRDWLAFLDNWGSVLDMVLHSMLAYSFTANLPEPKELDRLYEELRFEIHTDGESVENLVHNAPMVKEFDTWKDLWAGVGESPRSPADMGAFPLIHSENDWDNTSKQNRTWMKAAIVVMEDIRPYTKHLWDKERGARVDWFKQKPPGRTAAKKVADGLISISLMAEPGEEEEGAPSWWNDAGVFQVPGAQTLGSKAPGEPSLVDEVFAAHMARLALRAE